ncbi:hypothetical protein glysoja_012621 [Glycine soja]|nr:hypothetical protein glysoja_012621 [Glycine soja]
METIVENLISFGNLADRPSMASVVLTLNSYSHTLPVPSELAFFYTQERLVRYSIVGV